MKGIRKQLACAAACTVFCATAIAGGGWHYYADFFSAPMERDVAAGRVPITLYDHHGVYPLLVWLHLSGRYTPEHARLFSRYYDGGDADHIEIDHKKVDRTLFTEALAAKGFQLDDVDTWRRVWVVEERDGKLVTTTVTLDNCRPDAFDTASSTFLERRSRYGSDSVELERWLDAQIAVFRQCDADVGEPLAEPASDWQAIERHDRRYQIAAWHFYRQRYLQAAERFERIGATAGSPWRDLARYLVPRSLARHASIKTPWVVENYRWRPSEKRERHLKDALARFKALAADGDYLARFPSVRTQMKRMQVALGDTTHIGDFERRLIEEPSSVDPNDIHDFDRSARFVHSSASRPEEYRRWLGHATDMKDILDSWGYGGQSSASSIFDAWRDNPTPPYLYLALNMANGRSRREDLRQLLAQSNGHTPETPGYVAMLTHRLRVAGLLRDEALMRDMKAELARQAASATTTAAANSIRLRMARAAIDAREYVRWASLLPIDLPWSDETARRLPTDRYQRVTRKTRLFPREAANVINTLYTLPMLLDALTAPEMSDYQRSRLAIAAWLKALFAGELDLAVDIADTIGETAPHLAEAMDGFKAATDKRFEAAWIVLHHPGFSPLIQPGVGRTDFAEPAADRIGVSMSDYNWWCMYETEVLIPAGAVPYFARDPNGERPLLQTVRLPSSAAGFFGPWAIGYAKDNLDDPRVPQALHRVVFATRHSCASGPGSVSRSAYAMLHKHFPDSEWTKKTPHWYN